MRIYWICMYKVVSDYNLYVCVSVCVCTCVLPSDQVYVKLDINMYACECGCVCVRVCKLEDYPKVNASNVSLQTQICWWSWERMNCSHFLPDDLYSRQLSSIHTHTHMLHAAYIHCVLTRNYYYQFVLLSFWGFSHQNRTEP